LIGLRGTALPAMSSLLWEIGPSEAMCNEE
jgi:hypothetical protein